MQTKSWKRWAIGGVAAATLMAGSLWAVDSVSAAAPEPAAVAPVEVQNVQTVRFGPGTMGRGTRQFGVVGQTGETLLADALGISVEELQAAQDTAQAKVLDAALAQAVADGKLTQAQADAFKELQGLRGNRSFGEFRMGSEDHEAYLAEALGITVEELQAAKDAAAVAGLAQAVADGKITQEQADLMTAGLALKDYVGEKLQGIYEETVQQAVQDGVITQEQADQLLDSESGFFGRGGFPGGMRGGFSDGMRGGFPGGMKGGFSDGMRGGFPGGRWGGSVAPDIQSSNGSYAAPGSLL